MASSLDALSAILEEDLSPTVESALVEVDPIVGRIALNTSDVKTAGGKLGRDWEAHHAVKVSQSGTMKWSRPDEATLDPATPVADYMGRSVLFDTSNPITWPSVAETPIAGYVWLTVGLKRVLGSVVIEQTQFDSPKIAKTLVDVAGDIVGDQARLMAEELANYLAGEGAGLIGGWTQDGNDLLNVDGDVITITLNEAFGRSRYFRPGMNLMLYTDDAVTAEKLCNDGTSSFYMQVLWVDDDQDAITVNLRFKIQTSTVSLDDTVPYYVTRKDCAPTAGGANRVPEGLGTLIGNDGNFLGLARAANPEFQSIVNANGGVDRDLDALLLNQVLAKFEDRGVALPSLIVSTRGVQTRHIYVEAQMKEYNVQSTQPIDGGWTGIKYTYGSKVLEWFTSAFIPRNICYLLTLSDFVRYAPEGAAGIRWLREGGSLWNRVGVPNQADGTVQATSWLQALYMKYYELACKRPRLHARIEDCLESPVI